MNNLRIGYDDNLGLPADFSEKIDCEITPYHELGNLVSAFENDNLDAIFIPVGTIPYIKNADIVAQSLFSHEKKLTLQSNFVSTKAITVTDIPKLRLGCVNQYCTTSYWAPMIYLMNFLPIGTMLTYQFTNGFVDLLHQTVEKKIDGAMVWDIILKEQQEDASQVKEFFSLSHLPTPVIVAKSGTSIPTELTTFISDDDQAFFTGFKSPNMESIHYFLEAVDHALQHFKIITVSSEESKKKEPISSM